MKSTEKTPITIEELKQALENKEFVMGDGSGIVGLKRTLKELKKEGRSDSYPIFVTYPNDEYWRLEWIKIQ